MRLNSARDAWHDAFYMPWDSLMAGAMDRARIGIVEGGGYVRRTVTEINEDGEEVTYRKYVFVPGIKQTRPERDISTGRSAHQALAAHVQQAIDSLPVDLRRFGHYLYNPLSTKGDMVAANLLVWRSLQLPRMTKTKQDKAFMVCCGVLYRYRRMHQGGQSEGVDPCPTAESFRAWMLAECKVSLPSENWGRDWAPFVELCFAACDDLDRQALVPVAMALGEMKEAA